MNFIDNIQEKYFSIVSGLGSSTPKALVVLPLKIEALVIGVIEIVSVKTISKFHKEFLL